MQVDAANGVAGLLRSLWRLQRATVVSSKVMTGWLSRSVGTRVLAAVAVAAGSVMAQEARPMFLTRAFAREVPRQILVSQKGTLRWTAMMGDRRLRHVGTVTAMAIAPKGGWLVSTSMDGTLRTWSLTDGRDVRSVHVDKRGVSALHITADGTLTFTGGGDVVSAWDARSGSHLYDLRGHRRPILAIASTPNKEMLVTASVASRICFWKLKTRELVRTVDLDLGPIASMVVTLDGKWLITGSDAGGLLVWDLRTCTLDRVLRDDSTICALALNTDGTRLATGTSTGLAVRDVPDGRVLPAHPAHKNVVSSVAYSPDGAILASGDVNGTVHLWDGRRIRTIDIPGDAVMDLAFGRARTIFIGTRSGRILAYDLDTMSRATKCGTPGPAVIAVAIQGTQALVSGHSDGSWRAWDLSKRTLVGVFGQAPRTITAAALSRNGGTGVAAEFERFHVWRRGGPSGEIDARSVGERCSAVYVTPDGRRVVSGFRNGKVVVWPVAGERAERVVRSGGATVTSVVCGRDTSWIAAAIVNGSIEVWRSSLGWEPLHLRGHGTGHQVLSLSADGKLLISGGNDGQIRIWSVRTWELASSLSGYDGKVSALDLDAAGGWLYAGVIRDGTGLLTVRRVGRPDLDSIVVPGRPSCITANKSEVWIGCADGTVCGFAHRAE